MTRQRSDVTGDPRSSGARVVWVADWSDEEHAAFLEAAADLPQVTVLRGAVLGGSVGSRWHRLRSYPTYLLLALRGIATARRGHLVAWQPLAGCVAALLVSVLPRRVRPRVTVCNPILSDGSASTLQKVVAAGLRRADQVVVYSHPARAVVQALGVPADRVRVVLLGVPAREAAPVGGDYFLAAGRDHRDWATLAGAAPGLCHEVRVAGPDRLDVAGPLVLVHPGSRTEFLALLAGARAVVVPLLSAGRPAGQLAVLDALSLGVPVVATDGQGMGEYVTPEVGRLVPVADPGALALALVELDQDGPALTALAAAAHARARAELSLRRFVLEVSGG